MTVSVGVTRRVGVRITVSVVVTEIVGAGFVRSTVGVIVGGSRVGIGAWVGVEINVPLGRFINVGITCVGVAINVGTATCVAVG